MGASRDKQTAADTSALSGFASTGAATYSFIQASLLLQCTRHLSATCSFALGP